MRCPSRQLCRPLAPAAIIAVLLLPRTAPGQSVDHGPLAVQLSSSTAAQALGGAAPLARPTSDVLFAHPAVLTDASGVALSLQAYGDGATYLSASGAREWWSGTVGVGIRALSYAPASGVVGRVPTEGALFREGDRSVSEIATTAGYAATVLGFGIGVTGTWIERRRGSARDRTLAADVGVARDVAGGTVALSGRNLGPDLDGDGPDALPLPTEGALTGAFRGLRAGPLDLGAAAEIAVRADGEAIPGGGLEVAWWPIIGRTFVGRIGVRRTTDDGVDPLTLGAAFWGDDIGLEYAWQGADGDESVHRFGLFWR